MDSSLALALILKIRLDDHACNSRGIDDTYSTQRIVSEPLKNSLRFHILWVSSTKLLHNKPTPRNSALTVRAMNVDRRPPTLETGQAGAPVFNTQQSVQAFPKTLA